ncbi:hypothetical protein T05_193, partial [Trichinella murrelli]
LAYALFHRRRLLRRIRSLQSHVLTTFCQMRELNTRRSSVFIMAILCKMEHPSTSFTHTAVY